MVILFSLTLTYPFKHTLLQMPFSDPLIHLFSFGTLMYFYCQAWKQNHIRIVLGVCLVILGIGLETLQASLWKGSFEFKDGFANTLGVGLGYFIGNLQK